MRRGGGGKKNCHTLASHVGRLNFTHVEASRGHGLPTQYHESRINNFFIQVKRKERIRGRNANVCQRNKEHRRRGR